MDILRAFSKKPLMACLVPSNTTTPGLPFCALVQPLPYSRCSYYLYEPRNVCIDRILFELAQFCQISDVYLGSKKISSADIKQMLSTDGASGQLK